jgi:hypothetical protein
MSGTIPPAVVPERIEAPDDLCMAAGRRRAITRGPAWVTTAAAIFYAAFAVFLTWPLAPHLGTVIYGQHDPSRSGDLAGGVAMLREMVRGHHNPFLPGTLPGVAAPFGLEVNWQLNLATLPSTLPLYLLALAFGATAAFGIFTIAGYVLSATAMFLFARRLSGSAAVGLIIGWAFAFFPYSVLNGTEHPHFVHTWVFVLAAWRMTVLSEAPTRRNGLLAGASVALSLWWTPYFTLLGTALYVALAGGDLLVAARQKRLRARIVPHLCAAAVVTVALVALTVLVRLGSSTGVATRSNPLDQLNQFSARLYEYVIPPAQNLLFGGSTGPFLADRIHDSSYLESTLYLGLSIIALALVAVGAAVRGRLSRVQVAAVAAFGALAIVAIVLSLPAQPRIQGSPTPLPSKVIYHLAPGYRVLARFVIVVMLATCALAAVGFGRLLAWRSQRARALVVGVVAVVVALDVGGHRPATIVDLPAPSVYTALRTMPSAILAQYPMVPAAEDGVFSELYYRPVHLKPVLNDYAEGSSTERVAAQVRDIADRATPGKLAALGVGYVILPRAGGPEAGRVRAPAGLKLLREDAYARLYGVTARPTAIFRLQDAGHGSAEIHVISRCARCLGTLAFRWGGFFGHRVVTVTGPGVVKPLRKTILGLQTFELSVPLRFRQTTTVTLTARPLPGQRQDPRTPRTYDPSTYASVMRFIPSAGRNEAPATSQAAVP